MPRNTRLGRLAAASLVALATVTARPAAAAQPDFGQLRPLAAAATVAGRAGGPVRPPSAPIDGDAVARALGKSGQVMPGGVYRVAMPRGDLGVTVKGVKVAANFALGSYAAFEPTPEDAMLMGDLVLLDEEVQPVMARLLANGLDVEALHNHLNEMTPHVMYMHYGGRGDPVRMAAALHDALIASGTPLGPTPPAPPYTGPTLDADQLRAILGRPVQATANGVVQASAPRARPIVDMGVPLLPAMGVATALNFQPTGDGSAAVTGDFVLTADEVEPVLRTLRAAGIDVTALHSHALRDEPRLFYMHFWAVDDALKLARGLRAALDQTDTARA